MAGELVHVAVEVYQQQDGSWTVVCFCAATFTRTSRDDALNAHEGHWNVERLRIQLEKENDGADS